MFDLNVHWWELVVRALLVYAALLLLVRATGKRTVGQFTPFDLLVVMLLSEAVSNALSGGEESVTGGLISAATLVTLNVAVAWLTAHSAKAEALLEGRPVLIARDGKVFDDVLRRQRVSQADFEEALREADCSRDDVNCAFLEADGRISILQKKH